MLDGKRLVQCLIGHDTAKKGNSKKNRSRSPIKKKDDSAERQCVRKTGGQNPSGKDRLLRVSTAQQELIVTTERVNVGIHPHCKHVKKKKLTDGERIAHSDSQKKNRPPQHQSVDKRKEDNFTYLNVIQTGSKNGRSPNAPNDQKSTEWKLRSKKILQSTEIPTHKEVFKIKGRT